MTTQFENYSVSEINFVEPVGNDLGNLGVYSLTLTPDLGYKLDANNFSLIAPLPTGITNYSFNQAGSNVRFDFSFANGTIMPSNDVEFPLCIQGFALLLGFIVQGAVDIDTTNATPLPQLVPYSGSGEFDSTSIVYTQTILADSGYYFFVEPTASLAVGDPTAYNILASKSYNGPNGELTAVTFTVEYTYPNEDVSGDLINIVGEAIPIVVKTQLINAFNLNGASGYIFTINSEGATRTLNLIGDPGAIYSVSLFDDLDNETIYATNQVMGASGTAAIPGIIIPSYATGNPPYELKVTGQINTPPANSPASNPTDILIELRQQEPVFIEITATSTDPNLAIAGVPDALNFNADTNFAPGSEPILNFSFTATSSAGEIQQIAAVTENSFSPVIPDPASDDYEYSISGLASSLLAASSATCDLAAGVGAGTSLEVENVVGNIEVGAVVTGTNVASDTKVVSYNNTTGILVVDKAQNLLLGTTLTIANSSKFTVSGTITIASSGDEPITHTLDLDNILTTIDPPTIVTKGVSNETGTGADSGGESITDGGGTISSKGIQWSEYADFNTILGANDEGTGTADFTSSMTGLTTGNNYYVRAYVQNEVAIAYGQVIGFTPNITVPCSSTASPGSSGITDTNINLDSGGGLIAVLFDPQGIPDKLEIIHGGPDGTKVATSGFDNGTDGNAGPFDNFYSTEPSNTIPASPSDVANIDQFIGTMKGTAPTRQTQFESEEGFQVPNMTVGGVGYDQIIWWRYTASDWQTAPNVTIRVTGPASGTSWTYLRLCCPDANCDAM
jgi:hypothetical protein